MWITFIASARNLCHSCVLSADIVVMPTTHVHVPGVKPPSPLKCGANARADWVRFLEDWQDYSIVQDIANKPDNVQISLFRISLGDEGKKLLRNQPVPMKADGSAPMDENKLDTLTKMMEIAVVGEVNDTYERYIFRCRTQREGETIETFVTSLRELIKTCEVTKDMTDKFMKDQIIFGIRDSSLREKILQERKITLEKCIDMCRATESASVQARDIAHGTTADSDVNRVVHKAWPGQRSRQPKASDSGRRDDKECRFCGYSHVMDKSKCPAYGKACNNCGGENHFAKKCNKKKQNKVHHVKPAAAAADFDTDDSDMGDVGAVDAVDVSAVGGKNQHRALLKIMGKKKAFLLDTGATINLISTHDIDASKLNVKTPGQVLSMWNGSLQPSLGTADVNVLNPKTWTKHTLNFVIVPDKRMPILGCSAVQEMGLVTMETDKFVCAAVSQPRHSTKAQYVAQYPKVFQRELGTLEGDVSLQVDPAIQPSALPARQIPQALKEPAKQEIERLLELGIVEKITHATDWVSQMVTVHKRDGSVRLCLDPRLLNQALKRERYHVPTFEEVLPELADAKVFSRLDMKTGYWQVVLEEKSRDLTTFQTPWGNRYRWTRMPFGLNASGEIFMRKVHEALADLEGVFCIVDDIIVAGVGATLTEAMKSHDSRLNLLLERCQEKNIVINPKKFNLRQSQLSVMGHVLGSDGLRPDPEKVKAISEMPNPTDITGTRRLIGVVNYLSKFTPHLATVARPIHALLKKDIVWAWQSEHTEALKRIKALISNAPVLRHFDAQKPLIVQCDASKDGLGAALMQEGQPMAYASRAMTLTEQNYGQIEKELLSVVFAMEKFHQYTYGRRVTVENDHQALVPLQRRPIAKVPMRLQRMMMRLMSYDYEIVYVPGTKLYLADTLSRAYPDKAVKAGIIFDTINSVVVRDMTSEELQELKDHLNKDDAMCQLSEVIKNGWPNEKKLCPPCITPYWEHRDELVLFRDVVIKGQALVIPSALRRKYVRLAHTPHMGPESCLRRARESIFWPQMGADLKVELDKCEVCAKEAPQQQRQPLSQPEVAERAWSKVSADIMTFNNKNYLVTVDSLSGFLEIDRLKQLTSKEVILKLRAIFARFGSADVLTTDNGPQFSSQEFATFAKDWRFKHVTSSPHYPRANGQAEAAVKVAKNLMRKAQEANSDVYKMLLDYRNTPRQSTGLSPVQVLMGRNTRSATLPSRVKPTKADKGASQEKGRRQAVVKKSHDRSARDLPPLSAGTSIWYCHWHGAKPAWQKGQILQQVSDRSYEIRTDEGGIVRRNRTHVKPRNTRKGEEEDSDYDDWVEEIPAPALRRDTGYGFMPPQQTRSGRMVKQRNMSL